MKRQLDILILKIAIRFSISLDRRGKMLTRVSLARVPSLKGKTGEVCVRARTRARVCVRVRAVHVFARARLISPIGSSQSRKTSVVRFDCKYRGIVHGAESADVDIRRFRVNSAPSCTELPQCCSLCEHGTTAVLCNLPLLPSPLLPASLALCGSPSPRVAGQRCRETVRSVGNSR